MRKKWSEEDILLLEQHYEQMPLKELSRLLGRSKGSIGMKAASLGLTSPSKKWSAREIEQLRELAAQGKSSKQIGEDLDRSQEAVHHKMSRLGIKSEFSTSISIQAYFDALKEDPEAYAARYANQEHYNSWTDDEDAILREMYLTHTVRQIADKLGSRSMNAVKCRVNIIGLKKGYQIGENHAAWKGGKKHHSSKWRREVRPQVLERDGWTCQECGLVDFIGSSLRVHHILPSRLSFDDSVSNHVTLCNPCHVKQRAHKWDEITEDDIKTLPQYQLNILQPENTDRYSTTVSVPYDER